jgi:ferritin-like protein
MKQTIKKSSIPTDLSDVSGVSRRAFLTKASVGAIALSPFAAFAAGSRDDASTNGSNPNGLRKSDKAILVAAEIAEALAVTTYTNIINLAPFFRNIPDDDQDYLQGARQEEMAHYLLEQSVTNEPTPFTRFFYPPKMFEDTQTTLNVLVTLEDAFIAAYLVGVRDFTTADLRVTAARIMGIESDHRTLARVVGGDVAARNGGPIAAITGLQGIPESIAPPNNNEYERTQEWTNIGQAVAALLPFVDKTTAAAHGFDTNRVFEFQPFTPVAPNPLGEFIGFNG